MANPLIYPGAPVDMQLMEDIDKGRILKEARHTDTTSRSIGTGWTNGPITPIFTRVRSGSESMIRFEYRVPARNESQSWGGCYIKIHYSTDGGTAWTDTGDSGYSLCMDNGTSSIQADTGVLELHDIPGTQIMFRLQFRTYDGTATINGSSNISTGSNGWGWTNMYTKEISV